MGKKRSRRDRRRSPSSGSSSSEENQQRQIKKLRKQISKLKDQISHNSRSVPSVSVAVNETMIPVFDPSAENLTVTEWIQKVDELSVFHQWDDVTALKLATSRLRGNARKWYDTAQVSCMNWNTIKELLKYNFPSTVKFGKLLIEAAVYVPHSKQNLGDYCFEKVAKLNKLHLPIPDNYLIDSVIEGIPDKNVALAVRAANFQTVGELANYLSNIGNLGNKAIERTVNQDVSFQARNEQFKPKSTFKSLVHEAKKISCYNCDENHYVSQCRKPIIRCINCRKIGHTKEQCVDPPRAGKKD